MPGLIRLSEYQSERRGQGAKFCLTDESQIDLEGIRKKKYTVSPGASDHVEMMQGMMPVVNVSRPISEDSWEVGTGGYPKREIYI